MNMTIVSLILAAIVGLDHVLAAIPSIAANSTFQLITNGLMALAGIFPAAK